MDIKKSAGRSLARLRADHNITQEEMAERLHLSTSAYCKLEYGDTDLTLTRINKIAEAIGVDIVYLFETINQYAIEQQREKNSSADGNHISGPADNKETNDIYEILTRILEKNTLLLEILCNKEKS